MKRKAQILLIPTLTLGLCAVSTTASICAPIIHNEIFLNKIVKESINTFKYDICPIYHATFHTRKIADYLIKHVSDLGFEIHEDNYRAETQDSSGNLYYDIPSSRNCESWPGVTLQAHMDMVCEYDDKQGVYDWSKGVDIVQDGNILHSRNRWTSIGADDGIGLSLTLTLSKYHNEFTHGPIRVVITADEEDGDSGASALTSEVIKYDNIINIDGEVLGEITKACAGTCGDKYKMDLTWQQASALNQCEILVNGFNGGHSATEIDKGGSAIKAANDLLIALLKDANNVELLQFTSENNNNAIAKFAVLTVATDISDIDTWISNQKTILKTKYPNDTNLDISCTKLSDAKKLNYCLDKDTTSNVSYVVNNIVYGVKERIKEKEIATSSNIGPINLVNNSSRWSIDALIRSVFEAKELEISKQNITCIASKFESYKYEQSITPAWEYKENVALVDLIAKAFKQNKVNPTITSSHGWLECAFLSKFRPTAEIASIGADVQNAHNPTECCDITTIKPCLKTVLYALANITNK